MDSEVQLKEKIGKNVTKCYITYIHTLCFLLETQWDNPLPAIWAVFPARFYWRSFIKNTLFCTKTRM